MVLGPKAILGFPPPSGPGPYVPLTYSSQYNASNRINFGQFAEGEIQPTQAKTVGVWMKRVVLGAPSGSQMLVTRYDTTAGLAGAGWRFFYNAAQRLAFQMQDAPGANFIADITTGSVATDLLWHLAILTKSTLSSELGLNLYFDGVAVPHSPSKGGTLPGSMSYAGIDLVTAATSDGADIADDTLLCHQFLIDKELTAVEVAALYSATKPLDLSAIYSPAEIAHWCTLGDGCALGAAGCPDLSAFVNPGTAGGGMTLPDLQVPDVP